MAGRKGRDTKGRFAKGASGNPGGRKPRGLATVEKLRTALAEELPNILETVVKDAKAGDVAACRLILDRVLPPLKAAEVPVKLEDISGTLTEQGAAILQAMASADLSPSQAAQLLGALASQARIVEVDELERRLAHIEKRLAHEEKH